ncbi:hypothetical protein C8R46DRAFT_1304861 [Mycena filopes]|nr:hypothetical protein C8R46DRAFT_1304861 [Mycena filopes]
MGCMYGPLIRICLEFIGKGDPNTLTLKRGFSDRERLPLQCFISGIHILTPRVIKEVGASTSHLTLMQKQVPPGKTKDALDFATKKPGDRLRSIVNGLKVLMYGQSGHPLLVNKAIINKGGEVILPFEVEEAIVTVAKQYVKTALVFAIEHDVLQETIGVVVVPVPGGPRIGLAQLQDLLRNHLRPSKWPFAIVYMADVPKNAAGKPLRIKLATRLGIGKLTVPALQHHFEAVVPSSQAALSEPIQCSRVALDLDAIRKTLLTSHGVSEAALRLRADSAELGARAAWVDFAAMEREVAREHGSAMSEQALLVRDIVGNLLLAEPAMIKADSDFFLLGGNSLLLGKLAYQTGVVIGVSALFTNSTITGIAGMIESEHRTMESSDDSVLHSETTLNMGYDDDGDLDAQQAKSRGQSHPLSMFIQLFLIMFVYPLKTAMTWATLLLMLWVLTPSIHGSFWERMASLLLPIIVARLNSRIVAPLTSILFKWLVVGRYQPGTYCMWSLRQGAKLGEYNLLTFHDGCCVDTALIRGFCVERAGYFRLGNIVFGEKAIINTFTQISPSAIIRLHTVYGPHASSRDSPFPRSHAAFNRTLLPEALGGMARHVSDLPWIVAFWLMVKEVKIVDNQLNALEAVVYRFSSPKQIVYHALLSCSCMGAKVGKRVYWPGLIFGLSCLDPELLEIGNTVVFDSRSGW